MNDQNPHQFNAIPVRRKPFRHKRINTEEKLKDFAHRIEERLRYIGHQDAIINNVIRLLASSDERIKFLMTCKWVEWRYGKAKEFVEQHSIVEHSVSMDQARAFTRKMLSRDNSKTIDVEAESTTEAGTS